MNAMFLHWVHVMAKTTAMQDSVATGAIIL